MIIIQEARKVARVGRLSVAER